MSNKLIHFDWKKWIELEGGALTDRYYHFEFGNDYDNDYYNPKPYLETQIKGAMLFSELLQISKDRPQRTYLEMLGYWLDGQQHKYLRDNPELSTFAKNFVDILKLEHYEEVTDRTINYLSHTNHTTLVRFMYIMIYKPDFIHLRPHEINEAHVQEHPKLCYGSGDVDSDLMERIKALVWFIQTNVGKELYDWMLSNVYIQHRRAVENRLVNE